MGENDNRTENGESRAGSGVKELCADIIKKSYAYSARSEKGRKGKERKADPSTYYGEIT